MKKRLATLTALILGFNPLFSAEIKSEIYGFRIAEYKFVPAEQHPSFDMPQSSEEEIVNMMSKYGKMELLSQKNIVIERGDQIEISDIKKTAPLVAPCQLKLKNGPSECVVKTAEDGYRLGMAAGSLHGNVEVTGQLKFMFIDSQDKNPSSVTSKQVSSISQPVSGIFGENKAIVLGVNHILYLDQNDQHFLVVTKK